MKKVITTTFIMAIIVALSASAWARPHRPAQIPNGSKFQCSNCHAVPNPSPGNGPRNLFGQEIESNFLDVVNSSGNVQWGTVLAGKDSDGDNVSNGSELGDPNGAWTIGQPAPGIFADVTNPGDPSSVSAIPVFNHNAPLEFNLGQNFPNPFNPTTTLDFSIPVNERVIITIYTMLGKRVTVLVDEYLPAGHYIATWDGTDVFNSPVSSGTYLYVLQSGQERIVKKMLLMK